MNHFCEAPKRVLLVILLLCGVLFGSGCATTATHSKELPPLLAQDEVLRPYLKMATVEVRRARYGSPEDFTPDDYSWAYKALREEAARIGADAVILPEVTVDVEKYLFFPTSEIKARGTAIKFR